MASYADDIRRIAKQKGLKGGIGDLQPRDPIPGTITPFDASLFAQANDSTNPSNKTPEATDGDNPNTFNKGDGSGGDGTSGGSRDTNGPQDIEDILDDKAGPTLPDSNISDIFSGGVLNKITGLVDCDDGKCAIFNLDGEYIPPDGWDNPDDGPIYEGYVDGYFWSNFNATAPIALHPMPIVDDYIAYQNSLFNNNTHFAYWQWKGPNYWTAKIGSNSGSSTKNVYKYSCASYGNRPDVIAAGICQGNDVPPREPWPTSMCYQLAFKDGKIVSHKNDQNAPDWAQNGSKSETTLCTQSGRKVKISPASAGGTIVREVNNLGAAIGIVRVYNSDGTLRGAGDAAWIDSQKPR